MRSSHLVAAAATSVLVASTALAQAPALDTVAIEQATGLKGTFSKDEGVFKISKPRTDVKVTVDGWSVQPFMGLTSWAGFTPGARDHVLMMGDTVLFEDEVSAAMSAAIDSGLEVTALHNHFFFDEPKVYFMHIGGAGEGAKLAAGVRQIYDAVDKVRAAHPVPQRRFPGDAIPSVNALSPAPLEAAFGVTGQAKDGLFKVVIGRPAKMHGTQVGKEMGINTWAAFAGTDDEAVVDGDFAMTEDELQAVLKAMRKEGLNIVAIHSHMTHEEPRYVFLHYWARGNAAALAKSVRAVLDEQARVGR